MSDTAALTGGRAIGWRKNGFARAGSFSFFIGCIHNYTVKAINRLVDSNPDFKKFLDDLIL